MRLRPIPEVIEEIRGFRDKGVVFWDDNLAAVPAYAKELCRQLRPLKRWWTSQTTMNSLRDSEFLELAAASGCKALFVGLDIFQRTVDTFGDIGLDNATISLLVPYPGTPSYAMLDNQQRILDKNWRHYNGKTHVVFRPRNMTPEQLLNGYEWAKTQFYSLSHIAKRLNKSCTGLWWNLPRNLGYHLGLRSEVLARAALHQPSTARSSDLSLD